MTDKLREAAQQALEALVQIHPANMTPMAEEAWNKAIVMLGAALAEQQAEPVAWMWEVQEGSPIMKRKGEKHGVYFENPSEIGIDIYSEDQQKNYRWTLLYTAPQPAKPAERKPLTDEEIDALELPPSGTATVRDLVRLIERAHGIGETK